MSHCEQSGQKHELWSFGVAKDECEKKTLLAVERNSECTACAQCC